MGLISRFFERRRLLRKQRALIARLIPVALQVMEKGERFAVPAEAFYGSDDVSEFISRLSVAAGIPVRASLSDGLLVVYPDNGEDGLGISVAGANN